VTGEPHTTHWHTAVILAVVAVMALTASIVVARTHVIHSDTTPGQASRYPSLLLQGTLTRRVPWSEVETTATYDGRADSDNRHEELQALYRGEPLYDLLALVDDEDPDTFNEAKAKDGYTIKLFAADGYTWTVDSRTVVGKSDWVVASLRDGKPLPTWEGPYRFVGGDFIGFRAGQAIKQLIRIQVVAGRVRSQDPQ
jgi:hypothetical protein